jgi:hypothetical protein
MLNRMRVLGYRPKWMLLNCWRYSQPLIAENICIKQSFAIHLQGGRA